MMALFALQNDWYRSYGAGVAMMAFFLLTSVTLIANRLEITSIAISAITLGYVLSRSDVGADVCGPRPVRPWRGRGGATCGW